MAGLRIASCQLNPTVGDIAGNVDAIIGCIRAQAGARADVVAFGELAISGYPPEDLLLKPAFAAASDAGLERIVAATAAFPGVLVVLGAVEQVDALYRFNTAVFCRDGAVVGRHRKRLLPNYAVFDEHRWFEEGDTPVPVVDVRGVRVAAVVCEDIWFEHGPVTEAAERGADVLVVVNGSPYARGRLDDRIAIAQARVRDARIPMVYVNQVGGQDELIFDGGSFALQSDGTLAALSPQMTEHSAIIEFADGRLRGELAERLDDLDEVYNALVLATRDYVNKNGFKEVAVSLSGGIDSALVSAIAADALGADRVHVVGLPSRYSSQGSVDDAAKLAANFGIDFRTIPIEPAHAALLDMLEQHFEGRAPDLAEENLQSRIRGVVMMALSNKLNWAPILTCGNKSETAVGYSTLYGDTAGGYAVIRDCPKLLVYALARRRNERAGTDMIPREILDKAPSAELRPDQRDDQSLPPYEILDPIIEMYVEQDASAQSIVDAGFDEAIVKRVISLIDKAEYKRRQSPLGPRITDKAFGRDRRVPITNRFTG
ncbi:MAG: NAD+ synthase [Acidimicrobiales bacterium]|nr:NAD+ synthase [Acidimicrobiales bacterium]